tara:strand:+ start:32 stop:1285 length:1254 start_codon:yes stop_codon:yes gene_type:complete
MKWIGQHIYDLVSRFRDDVYLEDINTGTIASGGNLGLDSSNKIVKATVSASVTDLHDAGVDGSANQLLTDDGDGSVTSEANLTFDGSTLTVTGDLTVNGDAVTFQSANADDPIVTIKNTSNGMNDMASLKMVKDRADNDVSAGTNIAEIYFVGEDSAQNEQEYGRILSEIDVGTNGQESGRLKFGVANEDGGNGYGLTMQGGSVNDEIDVTVALGAASVTTIAGTLTMGSTAAMTNAGLLSVANQTGITGVGTISSGVWNGTAIGEDYIADDAVTFAKASGVTPNVYGNIIKLIPSDFMDNGDGGNTKFGVAYTDVAGTGYGMRPPNSATELYAFVSIPEGMKATHVDIYDKNDLAIEVFEAQINATTMTSRGSGNCNTTLDITDVNSTATNFLAIEVTTTSTGDRIYGGIVTIAAI